MIDTFRLDLVARRRVPFDYRVEIENFDASTADLLRFNVRPKGAEDQGSAVIALDLTTTWGGEGVSFMVDSSGDDPVTTLRIRIAEGTLEAVPRAAALGLEAGEPVTYLYELMVRTLTIDNSVLLEGNFTILPGVVP